MTRKPHSTSLVLLLVCIFTFWWGISVLAQRDVPETVAQTTTVANTTTASDSTALLVTQTIANGTYTYSGLYTPAGSCDSFGSGIHYSAADGGHIVIVLLSSASKTSCAQAATAESGQPFSVSIKLPAGSEPQFDGVLLNGAPLPAQLITAQ